MSAWTLGVLLALGVVTLLTRSFFFLSVRPWRLPTWVQRGLQYAPIAALSAVVVPEVAMAHGELVTTWQDARWWGAAAGAAVYFWKKNVLLTIVAGMGVYLPLHLLLGW